jgi:hypothetical protein
MESEADFKSSKLANLLPKEILHPKIADPVWRAFTRGEFDVAVFQAMKAVWRFPCELPLSSGTI